MKTMPGVTPQQLLWRDLRAYLEYERDEGRARMTVTEDTVKRVESWTAASAAYRAPGTGPEPSPGPAGSRAEDLAAIAAEIAVCTRCDLSRSRSRTVPGHGHPKPQLLFIGEAPGEEEDRQGLPFVGRSGELLTRLIENLGLSRDEVFIANINKCRPPGNRPPTPQERETCIPFLERQLAVLQPQVIITLGATALHGLLRVETPISQARGTWHDFRGTPVMPTYHPAYLLRNKSSRFATWEDMLKVLERIGRRPPPEKRRQQTQTGGER